MTDSCFICTTPYQIVAAVAIVRNEGLKGDLLIVPQFNNAEGYYKRIKRKLIFSDVKFIDASEIESYKKQKCRLLFGLGVIRNYVMLSSVVHKLVGDKDYKTIYISSQANVGRLISLYYLKKGAKIIYFDDGEGSYDDNKISEAQGIDRKIRTLLFGKESIKLSNQKKLYCPELYKHISGNSDNVSRLPNWAEDKQILDDLNYICGYSKEAMLKSKYILLDTIPSESFDTIGQEKYEELFNICVDVFEDDLIIKRHPRDSREYKRACKVYNYSEIPFEVICANSDISNKVLISASFSTVLMPKILFNFEPVVIMLHRITGSRLADEVKKEKMIFYMRELYKDKARLIIPETIDEFRETINTLKNKGGKINDLL